MRAVRDGASRSGKSRPALLGSRTALIRGFYSAGKKRTKTTLLLYKSRLFGQNEQHSEFCYPKKKKKEKKKEKKEKRGGHIIKCLLTELGRAGRENIWPSVMVHGPRCARSVRHDLGPNIFPSGPPTQSIST